MTETWKSFVACPDDLLFFRDGKPCTLGADHYLRSLFPPYPSTLYGAVRTRRLMDAGIDLGSLRRSSWRKQLGELVTEVGTWGGFGSLETRGPWLVHRERGPLLPAPLDLGICTSESSRERRESQASEGQPAAEVAEVVRYRLHSPTDSGAWSHSLSLWRPYRRAGSSWVPWSCQPGENDPEPAAGWYLTLAGLSRWAGGGIPDPEQLLHRERLWKDELRTGLGLQEGRRYTEESMLYTFGLIRMLQDVALGFEARGTVLEARGRLRLGGEGRTTTLEPGPSFPTLAPPPGETYCLYFATPTLSMTGAYPPGIDRQSLSGTLGGTVVRLLGALVPGFFGIGGWDMAQGRAKPLRRAIPAGATYLVEPEGGTTTWASELFGKNLSDYGDEALARQGFGLAVTGLYQ